LLAESYAIARRHNRTMLEFMVAAPVAGGGPVDRSGTAFVAKIVDKPALVNVRRRWTAADSDIDYAALTAEAWSHADGYELRQWTGVSPDEMVDGIAALESRLLMDAPTGDLVIEPEIYDADRMRGMENTRIARGSRLHTTVAIHVASGAVVANTLITVDIDNPDHAWQQITIVDPAHRGHRLGLLVKLANQTYMLENEPGVTAIDTFNASSNGYMIAVNERLGFRATEAWDMYQIPVPAA
jgi:RimJ/RimL family protein N-acetyltransferase